MKIFLFAFSIMFPFLLAFGFHSADKKNEPWIALRLFALGIISTAAVLLLERMTLYLSDMVPQTFFTSARAFLGVALPEETLKVIVLLIAAPRSRNGRTLFRFVSYGITAAMGFAFVENLIYLINKNNVLSVAVIRALSAIPLHALSGGILGLGLGLGVIHKNQKRGSIWVALVIAIALHGLYNWILINPKIPPLLIFPLLLGGWGGFIVILIRQTGHQREMNSAETDTSSIDFFPLSD